MSEMIERVARAICRSVGGTILAGGKSIATREMGWSPDGEYMERYIEWHWKEHVHAARFAIAAMREPTEAMVASAMTQQMHYGNAGPAATFRIMVDTVLEG